MAVVLPVRAAALGVAVQDHVQLLLRDAQRVQHGHLQNVVHVRLGGRVGVGRLGGRGQPPSLEGGLRGEGVLHGVVGVWVVMRRHRVHAGEDGGLELEGRLAGEAEPLGGHAGEEEEEQEGRG